MFRFARAAARNGAVRTADQKDDWQIAAQTEVPEMTRIAFAFLVILALAACSPKRAVVGFLADSLSGGDDLMVSDNDPELVREALPFGLKVYESLLAEVPEHRGLLEATAKGFTAYGYLLQQRADLIDARDYIGARELRARAHKLYLRGRDYALRGLDLRYGDFRTAVLADRGAALAQTTAEDIAFLYWAGAAWAGALSAAKDDMSLVAELPIAADLIGRVLDLDESYKAGSAHEFFIAYEGSRPGGDPVKARRHYERALELSQGRRGSVHLALAEAVSLRQQNLPEFLKLVEAALAVDPDRDPQQRLVNTIAHRRALWLRARLPELFVAYEAEGELS
jgi:tetratricopeptide (TPR) repeat protein